MSTRFLDGKTWTNHDLPNHLREERNCAYKCAQNLCWFVKPFLLKMDIDTWICPRVMECRMCKDDTGHEDLWNVLRLIRHSHLFKIWDFVWWRVSSLHQFRRVNTSIPHARYCQLLSNKIIDMQPCSEHLRLTFTCFCFSLATHSFQQTWEQTSRNNLPNYLRR